jgi:hypothetical protein
MARSEAGCRRNWFAASGSAESDTLATMAGGGQNMAALPRYIRLDINLFGYGEGVVDLPR